MATRLAAQRSNFVSSQTATTMSSLPTAAATTNSGSPPNTTSSSTATVVVQSIASSSPASASPVVVVTNAHHPTATSTTTTTTMITAEDLANAVMINGHAANVSGNLLILDESLSPKSGGKAETIPISLQHIIPQKKLFLQTTTTDGVSVIDVVPLEHHSNSNSGSPLTVQVAAEGTELGQQAQQVTAQVALVQSQSPNGGAGQHYITVTAVSSQDNVPGHHGGPAYHVQYVESNALYAANGQQQGQMTYPLYTVEEYTTGASGGQQYYATTASDDQQQSSSSGGAGTGTGSNGIYNNNNGSSSTGGNTSSNSGQGITSPNSSQQYLVDAADALLHTDSNGESPVQPSSSRDSPGGYGSSSGGGGGLHTSTGHDGGSGGEQASSNLSHATRVSPATVAWLMDNYETAEGVSLPRSTLYNHYMRHCNEHKLDAVNAASFGKLIRSVFTGLRTRRLGTRGNSKYHYYGIRVKPTSSLAGSMEEQESPGGTSGQTGGIGSVSSSGGGGGGGGKNGSSASGLNNGNSSGHGGLMGGGGGGGAHNHSGGRGGSRKGGSKPLETFEQCAQFLGDGSGAIPLFPIIDASSVSMITGLGDEITLEDVDTLRSIYREHLEAFLDAVLSLEFGTVESLWREFWRLKDDAAQTMGDECEEEKYLSKAKLFRLCQLEPVQQFIRQVDFAFYQNLVDVLIPDVLRPIPSTLTQAIRNFAKNLESWLTSSMAECPTAVVQIKLSAVAAFAQTLRRYTSLNHLAQAARAVLQNSSQIGQMLSDLNRVDFHNVQEQASWVCQCDMALVERLENDFKVALQQQNTLEQWAAWLRLVVDSALEEHYGKRNFVKAARQFLLKWSFYSSMVIRDLTLRSAASFGSFHLIRLLYDEYMFFIVEHKVAQATQIAPIAVMTECGSLEQQQQDEISLIYGDEFEEAAAVARATSTSTVSGGGPLKDHNQQEQQTQSPPLKRMRS